MLLTDRLKEQQTFSDTEIIIANYILNNVANVANMSINVLAENTFCSSATISRFCKKVKVENFADFKSRLIAESYALNPKQQRVEYNYPFSADVPLDEIAQKIAILSQQTVNDSLRTIDMTRILEAAKLLNQAQQISIYADGNSLVTGLDLHNKLLWIGKNSNLEMVRGLQHLNAKAIKKNNLAIIISYYGTGSGSIDIVKALQQSMTPYILITGPKLNPLCMHAAILLQVSPHEDATFKIAPISSRIALTFVTDILFSVLFSLDYESNLQIQQSHLSTAF